VIASAINKFIIVRGTKNKTKKIHFNLLDLNDKVEIDIDDISSKPRKGDHLRFVLYTLNKLGCNINSGMNINVSSDIYINAGISSSSALIVCINLGANLNKAKKSLKNLKGMKISVLIYSI